MRSMTDGVVDSIKKPRFTGVIDAYKQTWRETFDPRRSFSWNALARTKNFYKVSLSLSLSVLHQFISSTQPHRTASFAAPPYPAFVVSDSQLGSYNGTSHPTVSHPNRAEDRGIWEWKE